MFTHTNILKHSELGKNANKSFQLQQSLEAVLLVICTQTFPNMTELHVAQLYGLTGFEGTRMSPLPSLCLHFSFLFFLIASDSQVQLVR